MKPRVPRLLAITDPVALAEVGLEAWLRLLADAAVEAVQVRAKELDDRDLLELARRARAGLPAATTVLINGRPDVALIAEADGVHLPADGLPVPVVRRLAARLGRKLLVGRSTHRPDEVAAARAEGADYVTFGPVYPTPSKETYGEPPGLAGLARAAGEGLPDLPNLPNLPVLALGGVSAARIPEIAAAGAAGAAGIRMFLDGGSVAEAVAGAAAAWPR